MHRNSKNKISDMSSRLNQNHAAKSYAMSPIGSSHGKNLQSQYQPAGSSRKLQLLLQRSIRYSYRQRCCNCCPTILCELLFPLLLIGLLALSRYGLNRLTEELKKTNGAGLPGSSDKFPCSNNQTLPPTLSKEILAKCFQFPPSYKESRMSDTAGISNRTNFIFQPESPEINVLVDLARQRLVDFNCNNTQVLSQTPNDQETIRLLRNTTVNTIIIDFSGTSDLKSTRQPSYNILVRESKTFVKNDPIDMSFLSFQHPSVIPDRSNVTGSSSFGIAQHSKGSELPQFSEVKMFIDMILISYYTNRTIDYEIERNLMTCTPFREDYLFTSDANLLTIILVMVDFIFLIPFFILLTSSIREKNAKVKEILKVLGIEPILNSFAQALRTLMILIVLNVILTIVYKLKLNPDAFFNTVNFATLLLANLIISIQVISFCTMSAQIFETNVRAIIATLIFYFLSINFHGWALTWPVSIQYILMFLSPIYAARSLFQQLALYDMALRDLSYFRMAYLHVPVFFVSLILMLLSSAVAWLLAWYLEKVFPGQYGVPMPWNFLFKRDYWRKTKTVPDGTNQNSRSETASASGNTQNPAIVHVHHLVKQFGPDKIAVNDVSFQLYANQITSLLGPNGSGKTTIFNCLIGIYQPTSGNITMSTGNGDDYDTTHQTDTLRQSIGYCPQHDILFDLLTIEEQLQFYAVARGFAHQKKQISDEMLRLVNLEASRSAYCQSLSGGMKRRLSLACAFVGDTKIILLDEPSSGLDPSNRRLLWDWLRTMKEGKTLLLTTHFMEESDALSDRIMIIANGQIKADGTSAKLKQQYGSGYKLVINKQHHYRSNQIQQELLPFLPQLNMESDLPDGDVVFRANQQPDQNFIQALRKIETMKTKNLIRSYGVQNSTMDDVFLKITRDAKTTEGFSSTKVQMEHIDEQCRQVFSERYILENSFYYFSQFYGLMIKTVLVHYRRWALTVIMLLSPILYNILSNVLSSSTNASGIFKMDVNALNPQMIVYNAHPTIETYFKAAAGFQSKHIRLDQRPENISQINNYILGQRKQRLYTYTENYLAFEVIEPTPSLFKIKALSSNLIAGYELFSVASDTFFKYVLNDSAASIQSSVIYKKTGNFTFTPNVGEILNILSLASCFLKLIPTGLILDVFVYYLIFFYIAVFLVSERKDSFLSLLNISGLHPALYWISNYLFDIVLSIVWFCYLLLTFCIIDIAFNGSPSNRQSTLGLAQIEFASSWDLRIQFYPLSILIALPTLPFVYLLTKIFKSDILGGLAITVLLIIIHVISIVVPMITTIIDNNTVRYLLYWLFNIISPTINAQAIITYIMARKSEFCQISIVSFDDSNFSFFKTIGDDTIGLNWLILVIHAVLILILLIMIDCGLIRYYASRLVSRCRPNRTGLYDMTLDQDVALERQRILKVDSTAVDESPFITQDERSTAHDDHLVVHDLVKSFRGRMTPAVNHLTFGAKRGEAFGLLGYNGAGKTTTFRILVGDEIATQGTAYIDNQNVRHRLRSIRHLGYCPQQDCSMDFLNVRDGLTLLARIRGIYPARIPTLVRTICSLFLLDPFVDNYIHQLSGGTKRRLHAALALIGPPLVAILDEPTTGVDPDARQQMQEIFLNAVKANLTIVLTSHSMDECERVCNRLGIMVNGQFACLGAIQHLKSKFGEGYTVDVKVHHVTNDPNNSPMQTIHAFLTSQPNFTVEVRELSFLTGSFQVKQGTPADLFELLEQHKGPLNIETYTISQTTLEQIFLSIGKHVLQS